MAKPKILYTIRKVGKEYVITKCDEDFNPLEMYSIQEERDRWFCSCPNTLAPVCRHMKMLAIFKKKRAVGKGMFYCYDTEEWTKVRNE